MLPKRTIAFVVDDENVIASTLELIVLSEGFDARSFVDPLDALQAASSVQPDLLLTDVVMEKMTGIELAIQIQRLHPDCNVLLSSGQIETGDLLSNANEQGHRFEILAKPVDPTILLEKIRGVFSSGQT